MNTVVRGFLCFWQISENFDVYFRYFFVFAPEDSRHFDIIKKWENIQFDYRKLRQEKSYDFLDFLVKKSSKDNTLEVQIHFFFIFLFFWNNELAMRFRSKRSKKKEKNFFFQLLQKSLHFWRFHTGRQLFFVVKNRKSTLFSYRSFLKTQTWISHKPILHWYSHTFSSLFRSKPTKNSCEIP